MSPVSGIPGKDFSIEDVRGEFPEELEIQPLPHPVNATVTVPGSKSVTNRALLLAALADGPSTITNPLISDDSFYLMQALATLGFLLEVKTDKDPAKTQARTLVQIEGQRGIIPVRDERLTLFAGNAGTVARFLPPILALGDGTYVVDGVPRMRERPVADLVDAMRLLGVEVGYAGEDGKFPVVVYGGGIRGGKVRVEVSQSSQFLSGLLVAAPYAGKRVILVAGSGRGSKPYVGITTSMMADFGVEVLVDEDLGRFEVSPSFYRAVDYAVEPDASAASYFFAAAAVTGGRIRVPGLGNNSPQGDLKFVGVLERMGCGVEIGRDFVEVRGPERLCGVEVDMNEFSDTMMTLAAIAPFAATPTIIKNVGHTRRQETDRISAVVTELGRLGVRVSEGRDGLRVEPGPVVGASIETYGDHRMAMAFSITGLVARGIRIRNPSCVTKTFPEYFRVLDSLR